MAPSPEISVDVVYTWVDGSWPGFMDQVRAHAESEADGHPKRYRDLHQILRYSLRSLETYAPWTDRVYLVTARPQVPAWLDTGNPRLRLVHHDEYIPSRFLPTFNSRVIESYMHELPGIADHFLMMNDDYLFGRRTERTDFLTAQGRVRLFGTLLGECMVEKVYASDRWFLNEWYLPRFINLSFVEHTPRLIDKQYFREMFEWKAEDAEKTRSSKFRRLENLRISRLYNMYCRSHYRDRTEMVTAWELSGYHSFLKVNDRLARQRRAFSRLRRKAPKFYCLNDDLGADYNAEVVSLVDRFLESMYPEPSSFEL